MIAEPKTVKLTETCAHCGRPLPRDERGRPHYWTDMSISEYAAQCDADMDYRFHVAPPLGDVVAQLKRYQLDEAGRLTMCINTLDYLSTRMMEKDGEIAELKRENQQLNAGLNALQLRMNQEVNRLMHELSQAYIRIAALEAELAHRKMNEAE